MRNLYLTANTTKKNYKTQIISILFFLFSTNTFTQNYFLSITSKDSIEVNILKKIDFRQKHSSEKKLLQEVELVASKLKSLGYFNLNIEYTKKDSNYSYFFSLGTKVTKAIIKFNNSSIEIPFEILEAFLTQKTVELDNKGQSFSEVQLQNIELENNILYAELITKTNNTRHIDKTIIKGYSQFPKKYIKNHFFIKNNSIISKNKLGHISESINSLKFVTETQKPQLLFSKDSTLLFLYLKKVNTNSFDGYINVTSKENNSGIQVNGNLSLNLCNIFHEGESFNLLWNSSNQNKSFKIHAEIPYIFNSPITPTINFNLHKQDSTFLNAEFSIRLSYNLSRRSSISINSITTSSSNTLNKQNETIATYNSSFLGIQYAYTINNKDKSFFNFPKFQLETSSLIGKRTSNTDDGTQLKFNSFMSYTYSLNSRNTLLLNNHIGYLKSNNYLNNELFRIGGQQTIRGFNEQSILTSTYILFNLEYHYLLNKLSSVYSITDYGKYKFNNNNNSLIGLGIGYKQFVKNTLINLEYSVGKTEKNDFDFKNSFITIKVLSFF
ncbi:hypothetical protein ACQY1Q_04625 [Tenacibaculum sp. TC6]|uniref:hypothetical protein n=1 Tax=Tenacibaculum sp. TC6 TaxID=3423223 RepID=UPI003D363E07